MAEHLESRLVFLEFIGLPGAGKSTVARKLHVALEKSGINVVSVKDVTASNRRTGRDFKKTVRRISFYLEYIIRHAGFFNLLLGYVLKTRPLSISDAFRIRHIFGLDEVYRQIESGRLSNSYEVAISEDGFLQVAWSLTSMRDVPRTEDVIRLLENLMSRHRIYPIFVMVDPHTALERMLQREGGRSRFALCARNEALTRLKHQRQLLRVIYEVSKHLSPCGGISLSALRNASENASAIKKGVYMNIFNVSWRDRCHTTSSPTSESLDHGGQVARLEYMSDINTVGPRTELVGSPHIQRIGGYDAHPPGMPKNGEK
jgi:hypothetical protein